MVLVWFLEDKYLIFRNSVLDVFVIFLGNVNV